MSFKHKKLLQVVVPNIVMYNISLLRRRFSFGYSMKVFVLFKFLSYGVYYSFQWLIL